MAANLVLGLTDARLQGVIEQISNLHEAVSLGSQRPPRVSIEKCKEWGFSESEIDSKSLPTADDLSVIAIRAAVGLLRAAGEKKLANTLLLAADEQ